METLLSIDIKKNLHEKNCVLKTDTKMFTTKNEKITYICSCGNEKTQMIKDFLRRNCRKCNENKIKDEDFKDEEKEDNGEIWKRIKGGWISSLGKCKNVEGKEMTLCMSKFRYNIGGKQEYASRLVAKAFKIDEYEKLEGNQNFIVRFKSFYEPKDKSKEDYIKTIENFKVSNLRIGKKTEYTCNERK